MKAPKKLTLAQTRVKLAEFKDELKALQAVKWAMRLDTQRGSFRVSWDPCHLRGRGFDGWVWFARYQAVRCNNE